MLPHRPPPMALPRVRRRGGATGCGCRPPGGGRGHGAQQPARARSAAWPWALTFDGSVCGRDDRVGAGAAAVLHGPRPGGGRSLVARIQVFLPTTVTPLEAEGWGAAAGYRLLLRLGAVTRRASVGGDCPPVVRWGAGAGRLRSAAVHDALGGSLADTHAAGWPLSWNLLPRRANAAAHGEGGACRRPVVPPAGGRGGSVADTPGSRMAPRAG